MFCSSQAGHCIEGLSASFLCAFVLRGVYFLLKYKILSEKISMGFGGFLITIGFSRKMHLSQVGKAVF